MTGIFNGRSFKAIFSDFSYLILVNSVYLFTLRVVKLKRKKIYLWYLFRFYKNTEIQNIFISKLIVWVETICFWKSERIATRRNDLLPIGTICDQQERFATYRNDLLPTGTICYLGLGTICYNRNDFLPSRNDLLHKKLHKKILKFF